MIRGDFPRCDGCGREYGAAYASLHFANVCAGCCPGSVHAGVLA